MAAENPHREYDKSRWGTGPWLSEPDRVEFEHKGLPCLALRNDMGAWCGYVAVPPSHPLYKVDYCGDVEMSLDVHGGITYGHECSGPICHVPKPGEPDNVWWFGFDCAHSGDLVPSLAYYRTQDLRLSNLYAEMDPDVYRDLGYVQNEIRGLADQLAALATSKRKTRKIVAAHAETI